MAHELLSQSRKLNKRGSPNKSAWVKGVGVGLENFLNKNKRGDTY